MESEVIDGGSVAVAVSTAGVLVDDDVEDDKSDGDFGLVDADGRTSIPPTTSSVLPLTFDGAVVVAVLLLEAAAVVSGAAMGSHTAERNNLSLISPSVRDS